MNSELVLVLTLAITIDRVFGEPPNPIHTTAWIGKLADFLRKRLKDKTSHGVLIFLLTTLPFVVCTFLLMQLEGVIAILVGAWLLKLQFSWRGLADHAIPVAEAVENGDLEGARRSVPSLVGRDPSALDRKGMLSAAVESIGESSVDGILSPIFYYALIGSIFGLPAGICAAVFYRVVNTLDSMVGYKKEGYERIGFFSAKIDDILNYLPARISAILIFISSFLLKANWKKSIKIYLRDRRKTPSPNSGNPMSALAGSLEVRLEKQGFYRLGDEGDGLKPFHVNRALRIVDISTLIICSLLLTIWVI